MKDLVLFLFEKTGHQVSESAISASSDEQGHRVTLTLNKDDINRFATHEGRLMRSFRGILSAAAAAQNTKVTLEVNEAV